MSHQTLSNHWTDKSGQRKMWFSRKGERAREMKNLAFSEETLGVGDRKSEEIEGEGGKKEEESDRVMGDRVWQIIVGDRREVVKLVIDHKFTTHINFESAYVICHGSHNTYCRVHYGDCLPINNCWVNILVNPILASRDYGSNYEYIFNVKTR